MNGADSVLDKIARFIPDIRVWLVIGYFGLAWRLLYIVAAAPALLNSAPFMTIVTLVMGGGLGTIVTFYYGGTKTGSEVMKSNADTLNAASAASNPTPANGETS